MGVRNMKSSVPAALGAVMFAFGLTSNAQAAVINFSAAVFGHATYTGASLDTSTAIDLDDSSLVVGETAHDDASGLKHFDIVTLSPTFITYGSGAGPGALPGAGVIKSWVGATGDAFTETLTTVESINRGTPNAITVKLSGTVSDTAGDFVDTPVFLILSANQVGGPGTALSVLFTDTTLVAAVPETSTWVMMALGFAGLGLAAARRRKATTVSLSA